MLSRVRFFATPWTVAYQDPPSMGFSRQEYWRGLPFPSPGDLPDPGIEPGSPTLKVKSLSHVQLFATPWTVAYQDPPSMGFSRQEYWSGLPFPSPTLQADFLPSEPPGKPAKESSC